MRGERIGPCLTLCIIKDGTHHAAYELGIVDEVQRNGGIGNVKRCHTSVGEVLLGEEHHFPINFTKFVCRNGLTVSKCADHCIFGRNLFHFRDEVCIKFCTFGTQIIGFVNGNLEHTLKVSVNGLIISVNIAVEVLNRLDIIVSQHKHVGKLIGHGTQKRNGVEADGFCQVCIGTPGANGKLGNAVVDDTKACIGMHKVQISPIDAHVVARAIERILLVIAHPNVTLLRETINFFYVGTVTAKIGCGVEIHLEGVPFLTRCNIIENIGNGAREHLGLIKQ